MKTWCLVFFVLTTNLYAQIFPICTDSANQTIPSAYACSSKFMVSWIDSYERCEQFVYGQILSFTGALEKEKFLIGKASAYTSLSSGSNNNRFLATNYWHKGYFISSSQAIIVDSTEEWAFFVSSPVSKTACWDGDKYFVVIYSSYGQDKDKLFGLFLSPYGEITDTFTILTDLINPVSMSVAFNDTDYLIVWCDNRTGNSDIYGQRVSKDKFPVGEEIHIIETPGNEFYSKVASDGTNWLVVSHIHIPSCMCYRIVKSDGQLGTLDTLQGVFPSVTFCDSVYVVASAVGNKVAITKISSSGTIIDSSFIPAGNQVYNPDLCSQDANCFVAFSVANGGDFDLYGAIVEIGIEESSFAAHKLSLQVSPNPFLGSTRLIGYPGEKIEIYDVLGRKCNCKIHIASDRTIFGTELQKGIYFLHSPPHKPLKIIKLN